MPNETPGLRKPETGLPALADRLRENLLKLGRRAFRDWCAEQAALYAAETLRDRWVSLAQIAPHEIAPAFEEQFGHYKELQREAIRVGELVPMVTGEEAIPGEPPDPLEAAARRRESLPQTDIDRLAEKIPTGLARLGREAFNRWAVSQAMRYAFERVCRKWPRLSKVPLPELARTFAHAVTSYTTRITLALDEARRRDDAPEP